MALKSTFRAQLKVNGVQVGQRYWDGFSGGKYTQQEVKYVGWDGNQQVFTGRRETENVTLESNFEAIHRAIISAIGTSADIRGAEAEVTVFDLIEPGVFAQNRSPLKGRILEIVPPDGDSNDATTLEKIQIIVSVKSENQSIVQ